jgi:N-acetylmuramoyl-L-alanine amidase
VEWGRSSRPVRLGAAALALVALAAVALHFARSGGSGEGGTTAALPAVVDDVIYGAPEARGRPIVVLDAGHGGADPGALGVSGAVREKDLTLAFAQELRDLLVERGRVRVALTRDDDNYVPLDARAAVARRLDAALFVSLHMDSAANPAARGASVYSLADVASDAEAARVADAANGGAAVTAAVADPIKAALADLALRARMTASAELAGRLVDRARGRAELRPEPHKFAAFHVLRTAQTPAILVEAGYLSNAEDEAMLRDPRRRRALALVLAEAIERDIAVRQTR